ncbi:MAG TPA: hypothetical protein VKE96_22565 [Vicinamibacterales bacterium]|nr:hypothetical protein [Vicinamibacterales bacterium]
METIRLRSRHEVATVHDRTSAGGRIDAVSRAGTLGERIDAIVTLVDWVRDDGSASCARLDLVLGMLEQPDLRRRFQAAVGALLTETDGTNAVAHAGIPSERGFFAELGERAMNRVLPRPRDDRDLGHLLRRLFGRPSDIDRLARILGPRRGDVVFAGAARTFDDPPLQEVRVPPDQVSHAAIVVRGGGERDDHTPQRVGG